MHIYVSSELDYLKTELMKKGYKLADDPYKSDVILTNLKETNINKINNKLRNTNIMIIDSASRNINDIENILLNYYDSGLY